MNKCVSCKYCIYLETKEKAYCKKYGDYIEEQCPSCSKYKEVKTI